MFDDLIQRSDIIQAGIKETLSVANLTRREIQDSLRVSQLKMRAVATTGESSNGNGALTSSETMCKSKTDDTLASSTPLLKYFCQLFLIVCHYFCYQQQRS